MLRIIHSIKPSLHYIGAYILADYIVALEKDLKDQINTNFKGKKPEVRFSLSFD